MKASSSAHDATFTVIIAAYQAADTISEAIESVLAQTLPSSQIIVCDDGSTDDLETALTPFGERIVLLKKEHGGVASARNHALRAASGEFVVLLDADDVFLPERLGALGDLAASRPDLDLLCTDAFFEAKNEVVGRFYEQNRFAVENQRTAILSSCFVGWPAVRREQLERVGGFDESLAVASDWDAWMRMILAGGRAGLVPQPLLRYRLRDGSLSSDRLRSLRARLVLLDKVATNPDLRPEERRVLRKARGRARARARAAETTRALLERRSGARRQAISAALRPHIPLSSRAVLLLSTFRPESAARMLARQFEDRGADAPRPGDS